MSTNGRDTLNVLGEHVKDTVAAANNPILSARVEPVDYLDLMTAEAERLATAPAVPHDEILTSLLDQVQPVDFRTLAKLSSPTDKLRTQHYVVLVIQELLSLAITNDWNLSRRQGSLFSYNAAYWCKLDEATLRSFLKRVAIKQGVPELTGKYHLFVDQLYKQFLETATLGTPPSKKREEVLINLQNGTFEISLRQQILRPFHAEDFLAYQLSFAHSPEATAPLWQTFLDEVVPDLPSQMVLAEYIGYVFVAPSLLKLEKVLLIFGTGANGKSVFFEVVTALLGQENVSNYSLASLTGTPAYCRAHLATKLVNYASELNRGLEADTFKLLASGEPIEARLPYGQPFVLTDYAKLIFNCNELPIAVENTHAFFRRFLIIPFNVTIPEDKQDKMLPSKIINTELAGVFNWMLTGLRRLLAQRKFSSCEAAQKELEIYKIQSDTVRLFLDELQLKPSSDKKRATQEVYNDYRNFCSEFGNRLPVARLKFVTRLAAAGIHEERRNTGRVLFIEASA